MTTHYFTPFSYFFMLTMEKSSHYIRRDLDNTVLIRAVFQS
jgi:hypothetical protein